MANSWHCKSKNRVILAISHLKGVCTFSMLPSESIVVLAAKSEINIKIYEVIISWNLELAKNFSTRVNFFQLLPAMFRVIFCMFCYRYMHDEEITKINSSYGVISPPYPMFSTLEVNTCMRRLKISYHHMFICLVRLN